jgi:hypothetical protein
MIHQCRCLRLTIKKKVSFFQSVQKIVYVKPDDILFTESLKDYTKIAAIKENTSKILGRRIFIRINNFLLLQRTTKPNYKYEAKN